MRNRETIGAMGRGDTMNGLDQAIYADLKRIIDSSRSLILDPDQIAQIHAIRQIAIGFGFTSISEQIEHVIQLDRYYRAIRDQVIAKVSRDEGPTVDNLSERTL